MLKSTNIFSLRLLFTIMVVLLLGATSCSKSELDEVNPNNSITPVEKAGAGIGDNAGDDDQDKDEPAGAHIGDNGGDDDQDREEEIGDNGGDDDQDKDESVASIFGMDSKR